jgi:hypothetical protein
MAKKSLMSKIADAVLGPDKGPARPHLAVVMEGNVIPIPPAPKTRKVKKAKASKKRVAKKLATKKRR